MKGVSPWEYTLCHFGGRQSKIWHIRSLFPEQAHMPMCIEKRKGVRERNLLFSHIRTASFTFYFKKIIATLHRSEDQREVENGS